MIAKILPFLIAVAGVAHADPALPDAMRAKLAKMGPVQPTIIYVAPVKTTPARWVAFVGDNAAMSAWIVTPGAGPQEIARISDWPNAIKVVGAVQGTVPGSMPGNAGEPFAFVIVESLAAAEIGQPAGLRSVVPVNLPDPKFASSASIWAENLPSFAGVTDAADATARLVAAGKFWDEDTADKVIAGDGKLDKAMAAARKSDAALAKMIPAAGITMLETSQNVFARETGKIAKLDKSPAVKALRAALAATGSCSGHQCGTLLVGVENKHVVIRAIATPIAVAATKGVRKIVAANPKDTQTMKTAAMFGVAGAFRGEAPLGIGTGTIGVVDTTVIVRDGAYVGITDSSGEGDLRFGDFDGDGMTDVVFYKTGSTFSFSVGPQYNSVAALLQMASVEATKIDDVATAALALPDDKLTTKDACAVIDQLKTQKGLDAALAPNAFIFGFEEPGMPGTGTRTPIVGKDRVKELAYAGKCNVKCDARFPVCINDYGSEGPATDYYLFTRIKGALKLQRAAVYRGS